MRRLASSTGLQRELRGIKLILAKQSETAVRLLNIMQKPENKFVAFLKIAVLVVGVLGILGTIQIVRLWLSGG
jgi:hypothetical protein